MIRFLGSDALWYSWLGLCRTRMCWHQNYAFTFSKVFIWNPTRTKCMTILTFLIWISVNVQTYFPTGGCTCFRSCLFSGKHFAFIKVLVKFLVKVMISVNKKKPPIFPLIKLLDYINVWAELHSFFTDYKHLYFCSVYECLFIHSMLNRAGMECFHTWFHVFSKCIACLPCFCAYVGQWIMSCCQP